MPIVSDTLVELIRQQINAHHTVVWYDPEQHYGEVVKGLVPDAVGAAHIAAYNPDRGFVGLRHDLEPLWSACTQPPRLLIYVPLSQDDAAHAMVEFEVAGVVLRPNQQPQEQNTALSVVARAALAQVFPAARREEIVGQVEAGKLSLADLDRIADKGEQAGSGALGIVFGSDNPVDIVLAFLAQPEYDSEIENRDLLQDLARLASQLVGLKPAPQSGAGALRAQLARYVLMTDLVTPLGDAAPGSLKTTAVARKPMAQEAAMNLAALWRNRTDLASIYATWATKVEAEFGLGGLSIPLDALSKVETFAATEALLQEAVEKALVSKPAAQHLAIAEQRRTGFWARQLPGVKTRWDVILDAGRVLLESARIDRALKSKTWSAEALVARYARSEDDAAWSVLDRVQRHLERDFHLFDFSPQDHGSLRKLVARARQDYAGTADRLAVTFLKAYQQADFEMPALLAQAEVYKETVQPARDAKERVAYVLVDALRFEMGQQLIDLLGAEFDTWTIDLQPALATPPTVTEMGMTALLPEAERGIVVEGSAGKLLPTLAAAPRRRMQLRQERVAHFSEVVRAKVVATKLGALAPLSDMHLALDLKDAEVVLVTATEEIDTLCEIDPAGARRLMDDVFTQLRRGLKTLFDQGFDVAVVTSDHGHIFGEELTAGQAIDPPGGQTVALKRRVWVGNGGATSDSYMRCKLSDFGLSSSLEMATPWHLAAFKVPGGGMAYFHGGLSLPEIVIPVITIRAGAVPPPTEGAAVDWGLELGSHTGAITTRFVSVTITGYAAELLPIEPPLVRVEIRTGDRAISRPISAGYGFNESTLDVQLAVDAADMRQITPNTITLMITEEPAVDKVDLVLLNADTGMTLARKEDIPFDLAL